MLTRDPAIRVIILDVISFADAINLFLIDL